MSLTPDWSAMVPEPAPEKRRVVGRGTREDIIRRDQLPCLLEVGLIEFTHVKAGAFYNVVQLEYPLVIVIVCNGGCGQVKVGKDNYTLEAGQGLLVPAGLAHELRSDEVGWEFTIFAYIASSIHVSQVALVRLHSLPVTSLVRALIHEHHADADPITQRQLVSLIDSKLRRLADPVARSDRLGALWAEVARNPQNPWDLEKLACSARLSAEHLRRVARKETGRTPMEQVAWIRVQRAATLLSTTNEVVEQLAERVGYGGVRAFRAAFLRHLGCTPKAHRAKSRQNFSARVDRSTVPVSQLAGISKTTRGDGREKRYQGVKDVLDWSSINLGPVLNTPFATGSQPWFGKPLLHVRTGVKLIHGVPFTVRPEGCLMMRSARLQVAADGSALPEVLRIEIPSRVSRAYFLHACGWGSRPGNFASYRWIGQNGHTEEIPLSTMGIAHPEEIEGRAANIQDWYFSYDHVTCQHARPYDLKPRSDPTATSQFLYTLEWINPHPDEPISGLEIRSNPSIDSTLALLAITTETLRVPG